MFLGIERELLNCQTSFRGWESSVGQEAGILLRPTPAGHGLRAAQGVLKARAQRRELLPRAVLPRYSPFSSSASVQTPLCLVLEMSTVLG